MRDQQREQERIKQAFYLRQTRQIIAIAAALFLVILAAAVHKRPDLFGSHSKMDIFAVQAIAIAAFAGFTSWNWRCPACSRFLSSDIYRRRCRKCGAELQ